MPASNSIGRPSATPLQLVASRAPCAAFASLFSEGDEAAAVMSRTQIVRSRRFMDVVVGLMTRAREAMLVRVPCEDVAFSAMAAYAARRSTQT